MKLDAFVVLGAAASLFVLGLTGFLITENETVDELIPGGDPANENDWIQVTTEIRPFLKVGISSFVFGLIILLIFVLAVIVARLRHI